VGALVAGALLGTAAFGLREAMKRTYRVVVLEGRPAPSLSPALDLVVIPLLLAANPLPVGSYVPYTPPAGPASSASASQFLGELPAVETFDPVARAAELAQQLPRDWSGTYQPFAGGSPVTVQLKLASAIAMGQMVDVRGAMTVGSVTIPVQGNLNAKSDQLDLLLLGQNQAAQLEDGGQFLGLQAFSLSGWTAPRLTNQGGQLVLDPVVASAPSRGSAVRGLW